MSDHQGEPNQDVSEALQAVVAKAYAAVAEPQSFVPLLNDLIEADAQMGGIGEAADMHFANAEAIFDKVYPLDEADYSSMLTHLETSLECDLAIDSQFRVITVNDRVFETGVEAESFAPEWLFDPARVKVEQARLRKAAVGDDRIFLRLFTDPEDDAGRWFSAYRVPYSGVHIIALQAVRLRWDEKSAEAFQRAFALTETEVALTKHLVRGGSTREFAELRGRSVGTARNQLKALQRKLAINSKEQLLLLYAGFIHSLDPPHEGDLEFEHECNFLYADPQGRMIAWEEHGDPQGKPVLYFHALEGPLFTPQVSEAARAAGLRIIAPWRPFYGETTGEKQGPQSPLLFADRLTAFLDHLGIDKCVALGTQAGTPFLAAFAQKHPERLHQAVAAGPFLPIVQSDDYRFLTTRQRTHFKISRVAPAFARVYMRAMLASMGTGEFYKFVEDYYDSCSRESATVQRPEVVRNFRKAANYVLPRGKMGPGDTMLNWSAQWGGLLEGLGDRLTLLLGEEDANTPTEFAQLSARRFGLSDPVVIEDAGSFLIEDQPDAVFKVVRGAFC
ncbi:transcriptional regulator, LuxR family/hydrolase, alpha/beta fold family protein [Erythrobacter sp. NAP1]|uniref:alpha/beta fold hydrolase n=1 Tax=Erythrobacter sp. NAP1 TaxID=237727 RepID=UPI0000686AA6|nr:alpha/beta hydrolase [Erythrobacter sp. NAP1]EAQ29287.1 transcriptional regulator, LuxR family/hydrolase, alpha/beta fold family protein [Erythrobacter sp. NAP1]